MVRLACSTVDGEGVEESVGGLRREADGCGTDSDDRSSITRPATLGPRMLYLGGRDHVFHRLARGGVAQHPVLNFLRRSSDASGDCWHAGYNPRRRNHPTARSYALRRRRVLRTRVFTASRALRRTRDPSHASGCGCCLTRAPSPI